jgi:pimeloyl-ACP methyl ester carboxylesterase
MSASDRASANNAIVTRSGRMLEVWQYGDPTGSPVFFFHGLIGSHHQASYIDEPARRAGLRIIAPNRPGVGRSEFTPRSSALEAVPDVEDTARTLGLGEFSVIGISGGAPYALATLHQLRFRVRSATLISGMGPIRLRGALRGLRLSDRIGLEIVTRSPRLARREFERWNESFQQCPTRFLERFIAKLVPSDRALFENCVLSNLFRQDMDQVFRVGCGPESLTQEVVGFRNLRLPLETLPRDRRVVLWHGLSDDLVPPAMSYQMARRLPNCEAHFVPGGHFVAVSIAEQIVTRLRQLIDLSPLDSSRCKQDGCEDV